MKFPNEKMRYRCKSCIYWKDEVCTCKKTIIRADKIITLGRKRRTDKDFCCDNWEWHK